MRTKKKNEKVAYHTLHFICSLTKALRPKEKMSVFRLGGQTHGFAGGK